MKPEQFTEKLKTVCGENLQSVILYGSAATGDYITVIGPLGRPQIRRWLAGRSIQHLIEQVKGPIFYVPETRLPLQSALICLGGLGYEVTTEHLAVRVASLAQARVTLLHVIQPMDLDYPSARDIHKGSGHLADTDTLPGRALRQGLEMAQAAGLNVTMKVREGIIVEEILAEIKAGNYDLVCMGSPFSTHALRQMYAPNVAAEVADAIHSPILIARHEREA